MYWYQRYFGGSNSSSRFHLRYLYGSYYSIDNTLWRNTYKTVNVSSWGSLKVCNMIELFAKSALDMRRKRDKRITRGRDTEL